MAKLYISDADTARLWRALRAPQRAYGIEFRKPGDYLFRETGDYLLNCDDLNCDDKSIALWASRRACEAYVKHLCSFGVTWGRRVRVPRCVVMRYEFGGRFRDRALTWGAAHD